MSFFEKLKSALKRIKGKLIVAAILVLIILFWAVAPFTVAIKSAYVPVIDQETGEFVLDESGNIKEEFDWDKFFTELLGVDAMGDETEIGTGVQIIQEHQIGSQCIIGAGSVVIRDIPDKSLAVGVPTRIVEKDINNL